MKTEVIVTATGELLSLDSGTVEELMASLKVADSSYEAWRQMRSLLRERAVELLRRQAEQSNN